MNDAHDQKPSEPRSALLRAPRFRDEPVSLPSTGGLDSTEGPEVAARELAAKLEEAHAQGVAAGQAAGEQLLHQRPF